MSQGREGKGRGQGVDAAACRRGVAPAGTLAAAVAARGGARRVCWEPGGGGGSAVRRGGGGGGGGGMRHRQRLGHVPRAAADTAPAAAAATAGARAWTGPPLPPRLAPPRRVAARRVGMVGPLLVLFFLLPLCGCVVAVLPGRAARPAALVPDRGALRCRVDPDAACRADAAPRRSAAPPADAIRGSAVAYARPRQWMGKGVASLPPVGEVRGKQRLRRTRRELAAAAGAPPGTRDKGGDGGQRGKTWATRAPHEK